MTEFNFGKCAICPALNALLDTIARDRLKVLANREVWVSEEAFRSYLAEFDERSKKGPVTDDSLQQDYTSAVEYAIDMIQQSLLAYKILKTINDRDASDTQAVVSACAGPEKESINFQGVTSAAMIICRSTLAIGAIQDSFSTEA